MSAPVVSTFEKDATKIAAAIRELGQGRSNAAGVVTLRVSQTTTTVAAVNCGSKNSVFLFPATANAAAIVATTYVLESNVSPGQFIVTHPSNANTDKTFYWVALG